MFLSYFFVHRTLLGLFEDSKVKNIDSTQWSIQFNLKNKVSHIISSNRINSNPDYDHGYTRVVWIKELIFGVVG